MNIRHVTQATGALLASGVATLAFATPASAMVDPAPPPNPDGSHLPAGPGLPSLSDETPWTEIGLGVAGGLALAGLGIAAGQRARRRGLVHSS